MDCSKPACESPAQGSVQQIDLDARRNGLNPFEYLRDILERLPSLPIDSFRCNASAATDHASKNWMV
jgi:hypothetical protein